MTRFAHARPVCRQCNGFRVINGGRRCPKCLGFKTIMMSDGTLRICPVCLGEGEIDA